MNIPATPPVRKATRSAAGSDPERAAAAVRTLPRTARRMPMKPVSPDMTQPARNAIVRHVPDCAAVSASVPSGRSTAVDVANTTTTSGIRSTAIVRNWRRR